MVLFSTSGRKQDIKTMEKMGGISDDGRFTNHSFWMTTVRKLQNACISNDKIASITDHKSERLCFHDITVICYYWHEICVIRTLWYTCYYWHEVCIILDPL